jgi:hypothetical protein
MPILPGVRDRGGPQAAASCDDCGVSIEVRCDLIRDGGSRNSTPKVNEGQAIRKLTDKGWSYIRHRLRCPECEAKRSAPKEPTVPDNVAELRQPTREQKRQIIELLQSAYDISAERYHGAETDLSVAEAIGGGCMPGWVAAIREDMFGPVGANETMDDLAAELAAWRADMDKRAAELHDRHVAFSADLRAFNEAREKVADYERRLGAIKAAVGPKAARI